MSASTSASTSAGGEAEIRLAVCEPPRGCGDLRDLGGRARCRPEDFEVEELPAYEADGRPGHLLLTLRKRSLTTEDALRHLARGLGIPRAEIGVAGLKDRDALTCQWISVPERATAALARLEPPPAIELGEPRPHSHKLRRGHLRGNRFTIVIRELELELAEALARGQAKLDRLSEEGLRNYYGSQRFGREARNLAPGLAALAGKGRRRTKGDLVISAGQSALFNLALARRVQRGLLGKALLGDLLQKRETGGMFSCEDPLVDQARLDAGELVGTGPMFGSKMRWPTAGSPAEAFEHEVLATAGLDRAALARLGRKVPGTRRRARVWPKQLELGEAPAIPEAGLGEGLTLRFVLPPGSYATILLREVCGPGSAHARTARDAVGAGSHE